MKANIAVGMMIQICKVHEEESIGVVVRIDSNSLHEPNMLIWQQIGKLSWEKFVTCKLIDSPVIRVKLKYTLRRQVTIHTCYKYISYILSCICSIRALIIAIVHDSGLGRLINCAMIGSSMIKRGYWSVVLFHYTRLLANIGQYGSVYPFQKFCWLYLLCAFCISVMIYCT